MVMSLFKKGVKTGAKMLDEALTPSELKKKQAAQRRRTSKKLKEKEDPLKSFAGSKDPAIKKARQEAIDKAREKAKRTRGAQKKRQQKEKEAAVSKRKKQIGAGAAVATGVGTGVALSRDNTKAPKGGAGGRSGFKSGMTGSKNKTKRSDIKLNINLTGGPGLKSGEIRKPKLKRDKKADEAFKAARKAARGTVTGKGGRNVGVGENVRANVTREQLKNTGLTLRQYLNFMDKNDGKRPPKVATKRMGGMMKSKMASKGGKRGGMKKGGMAKKGYAKGGMMKSKGMARGGAMKKKGYASGGPVKKNTGKRTHPSAYEAAEKRAKAKKPVPPENKGLKKLPKDVRNKMGYMKGGGMAKKGYAKGGSVKKKGYSKGGAVKKKGGARGGKPRGVGVALRGFGKALR